MRYSVAIINQNTAAGVTSVEQSLDTLLAAAQMGEIVIAPEWFLWARNQVLDEVSTASLYGRLQQISDETQTLLIPGTFYRKDDFVCYNTLPIFDSGVHVLTYDKHTSAGDSRNVESMAPDKKIVYAKGTTSGRFNWSRQNLGVEICADWGELEKADKKLDGRVLASCGWFTAKHMKTLEIPLLMEGGYLFFCDGDNWSISLNGVYQKQHDAIVPLAPHMKRPIEHGTISSTSFDW